MKDRKTLISKTLRAKIFNMVSVGVIDEPINRFYDFLSIAALVLNLFFSKLGAGKPEQRQAQSARPTIMEE